ncbi:response regulator [Desulforamulus hydrothermalis]|uniref:Stage 0 sporulation protein A homolog n=1 Tax=Desulforamulus hydrothermalis Lam5 = DSM 18033 TaxID=1121428 RepID=K8EDP9_9FIRM|nr:response regulator transcription factor [Desulforamulus hydrothermalis]CCO06926.1 Two-component protein Kinase [Desulforamulus hydrothermalis Lam5 = DSM 18033]SHG99328.1 DNA-binding response regulator, NarL/FixJ family, contains REC and HTH domains [Desulforamulus hydrothermalis Lam5 = DSM 18033]
MIRVLIADDHVLLAESLQFMLQQDCSMEVVGIAVDGKKALQMCEEFKPEVVLLDIKMLNNYDGLEAAGKIKRFWPQIKVIILTTVEERENVVAAVLKGVDGYILKDVTPGELALAIKCSVAGFCVLNGTVRDILREAIANLAQSGGKIKGIFKPEEIKIIELIADGRNNREIAEIMNYSEGTIKNKVSRMLEAIGAKDRTQLVLYAFKNSII